MRERLYKLYWLKKLITCSASSWLKTFEVIIYILIGLCKLIKFYITNSKLNKRWHNSTKKLKTEEEIWIKLNIDWLNKKRYALMQNDILVVNFNYYYLIEFILYKWTHLPLLNNLIKLKFNAPFQIYRDKELKLLCKNKHTY